MNFIYVIATLTATIYVLNSVAKAFAATRIKKDKSNAARNLGNDLLSQFSAKSLARSRPSSVLLHDNEICHLAVPAMWYEKVAAGSAYRGRSVSVRVGGGVRLGRQSGRTSPIKVLQEASAGELVVTNQRIVFGGNVKSFEIPTGKITNVEHCLDYVMFHRSNKQFQVVFAHETLALAANKIIYCSLRNGLQSGSDAKEFESHGTAGMSAIGKTLDSADRKRIQLPVALFRADREGCIPEAADGTRFTKALARRTGFMIGKKGDEQVIVDYEEALRALRSMDKPYWRRPNERGNWGIVAAVRWVVPTI